MHAWLSLGLGLLIAWIIVTFMIPPRSVSYFTLHPWPLELDDSNLAMIGVGLASRTPGTQERPSVMDAMPAAQAMPVMTAPRPTVQTTPPVVVPPVPPPVMVPPQSVVPPMPTPSVLSTMAPSPLKLTIPSPSV